LGEFQDFHDIADTEFSLSEKAEDPEPGLVRERFEKLHAAVHWFGLPDICVYAVIQIH